MEINITDMREKYYKIKKEYAQRAGLNEHMREVVDDDYLMLAKKDITMISLTVEEKLTFLLAEGSCPQEDTPELEAPEVDNNVTGVADFGEADETSDIEEMGEATVDDDYRDLPDEEDEQGEEEVEPEIKEENGN